MSRINANAFKAYDTERWTLIPLHRPDAVSTIKRKGKKIVRKDGKRPLDFNWTTKKYRSTATIAFCTTRNHNIGVRLKEDQLVIDVDPRNGGTEGFKDLCRDLEIDPSTFPCVVTGSGGFHYYMSKPGDVPVIDTLKDYPGVEFKSKGRQVVAAGSIHPDTLKEYEWDAFTSVTLDELPPAPRSLLNLIRRPERTNAVAGGGQYSQEQLAKALAELDPTDFREHDSWLRLMMACHHATNGDARHEFIEWSVSDPQYADDAEVIGRRWDSLHKDKLDGITYRTLNHILREHDATDAQAAPSDAADDFDDDDDVQEEGDGGDFDFDEEELSEEPEEEADEPSALERLNDTYTWVVENGKPRIVYSEHDPVLNRARWSRMTPQDFVLQFSNRTIERAKKKGQKAPETIKLGKAWIEWPRRKEVKGIVFDPEQAHPGYLNLWDGWAIEPSAKGEWTWLREMIFEVLSNGDEEHNAYILNWIAFMLQHPAHAAEVAVVFKGGRGVGKGTLGNALTKGIGRHAIAIASAALITGRFNAHLQDVVFLFADEALKPYDKEAESRLKALITEERLTYEGKGRDATSGPNFLHVMMASNESWVIPAGMDERRFFVAEANTKWQGKSKNWSKLRAQLYDNGDCGLARFFFDMLKRPLGDFHPRRVPTTEALIDQKIRSQGPLHAYFFNMLMEGLLPFEVLKGDWETEPVRFFQESFREDFHAWCDRSRINPFGGGRGNIRFLLQEFRQLFPSANTEVREIVSDTHLVKATPSDGRAAAIELPKLADCRAAFERALNGGVKWPGTSLDFG